MSKEKVVTYGEREGSLDYWLSLALSGIVVGESRGRELTPGMRIVGPGVGWVDLPDGRQIQVLVSIHGGGGDGSMGEGEAPDGGAPPAAAR